jgi:hypothetical protein
MLKQAPCPSITLEIRSQAPQDFGTCVAALQSINSINGSTLQCAPAFGTIMSIGGAGANESYMLSQTTDFCSQCLTPLKNLFSTLKTACADVDLDGNGDLTSAVNLYLRLVDLPCSKSPSGAFCFPKFWSGLHQLATFNQGAVTDAQLDSACDPCLRIVSTARAR